MEIRLIKSYYASLCWFLLDQLGLTGKPADPEYIGWKEEMERLGKEFDFKPPVAGGPMFGLLYQAPSYINPQNKQELDLIQECINSYIKTNSIECFQKHWPQKIREEDKWIVLTRLGDYDKGVQLVNSFFTLLKDAWGEYKRSYVEKLRDFPFGFYEKQCNELGVFKKWEEAFGVSYPYEQFNIIICPEIPSRASSVGPDTIVFGLKNGEQEIIPSVIHEIGVRYANLGFLKKHPKAREIVGRDYVNFLKIIEAETCYKKKKHFPEIKKDRFLNPSWKKIVEWRENVETNEENYYDHLLELYTKAKKDGVF